MPKGGTLEGMRRRLSLGMWGNKSGVSESAEAAPAEPREARDTPQEQPERVERRMSREQQEQLGLRMPREERSKSSINRPSGVKLVVNTALTDAEEPTSEVSEVVLVPNSERSETSERAPDRAIEWSSPAPSTASSGTPSSGRNLPANMSKSLANIVKTASGLIAEAQKKADHVADTAKELQQLMVTLQELGITQRTTDTICRHSNVTAEEPVGGEASSGDNVGAESSRESSRASRPDKSRWDRSPSQSSLETSATPKSAFASATLRMSSRRPQRSTSRRRNRSEQEARLQLARQLLGDDEQLVNVVRKCIVAIQKAADSTSSILQNLTHERDATSRADNLLALEELIGSKPARSWTDEWVDMVCEFHRTTGRRVDKDCPLIDEMSDEDLVNYVSAKFSVDIYREKNLKSIAETVAFGWPPERAEAFQLLSYAKAPIARALREGDPSYSASTYALCDAFFDQAEAVSQRRDNPDHLSAPRLYTHLTGRGSLALNEPDWECILEPDATGFRGHTCSALVTADCDPSRIDEHGHKAFNPDPAVMRLEAVEADIVCFEPQPDDEHGAHSAVMFADEYGAFPPHTLFRLREICEAGTWEGPGGVWPQQRLIVVSATYRKATKDSNEPTAAKMTGSHVTLNYGDREGFVKGLTHVLMRPTLTMPLEFERDIEWVDWRGVSYSLRTEWTYVTGPAVKLAGCTPGTRDEYNEGKLPGDFLRLANQFILNRREKGFGTALLESDALLTINEGAPPGTRHAPQECAYPPAHPPKLTPAL